MSDDYVAVYYQAWKCGHTTGVYELVPDSENREDNKDNIEAKPDNVCPGCYARYLLNRLDQINLVMSICTTSFHAVEMAENRLSALRDYRPKNPSDAYNTDGSEFAQYSGDFSDLVGLLSGIEEHDFSRDMAEYVAAMTRFRGVYLAKMVQMLRQLGEDALQLSRTGLRVNFYAFRIYHRTTEMMDVLNREIKAAFEGPAVPSDEKPEGSSAE